MVTSGERITQFLEGSDMRQEHRAGYRNTFIFAEDGDGTPADGRTAETIDFRFATGSKSTQFNYNADNNAYNMRQYNRNYVDGNNNTPVDFTNVILLKTSIGAYPGDRVGTREVVTTGRGDGYFFSGGQYIEISWSRTDFSTPFVLTLKDDSDLELGVGKSYIALISDTIEPAIS
jgi:hypothetical protein